MLFVFCVFIAPLTAQAQVVKLEDATRQDWSGGVAGKYGSNYTFTITFRDCKVEPMPDTLWVGEQAIPLNENPPANITRTKKGNSVRFDIRANISKDEYSNRYYPQDRTVKAKAPVDYKGIALLSYKYGGRQKYFIVPKVMTTMQPIAYP